MRITIDSRIHCTVANSAQVVAMKRPASALSEIISETWAVPSIEPYYLRASGPGKYTTPAGDFTGVEYDIVRRSQQKSRKDRARWSKPVKLSPFPDPKGRCDLHVKFYQNYSSWHTLYHRVVAFTLLKCYWSVSGDLLQRPYVVSPSRWEDFHVHHIDSNTWDVSLSNLAILPKLLHENISKGAIKLKLPRAWPYSL